MAKYILHKHTRRSKTVSQFVFAFASMVCGVCFVIICSSSLLLLVPWEGCASLLWYFWAGSLTMFTVKY